MKRKTISSNTCFFTHTRAHQNLFYLMEMDMRPHSSCNFYYVVCIGQEKKSFFNRKKKRTPHKGRLKTATAST